MLIVSMCVIGWRSEDILQKFGLTQSASLHQPVSINTWMIPADKKMPRGMSLSEYAALAKTDPNAYQKLFQSNQIDIERNEADKLMNLFAHGKYE